MPGKDGLELFHGHARTGQRTSADLLIGGPGGRDAVEAVIEAGLEQQRNVDHRELGTRGFGVCKELADPRPDQWMNGGLELLKPLGLLDDPLCEVRPVDRAIVANSGEKCLDRRDGVAAVKLMHSVVGIHKDKKLPSFAAKTFEAQFAGRHKTPEGEPAAKIAFFSTCYVNYNQPEIGTDTLDVMAHNNVDVSFAYERCCGMPLWHNGDMDGAIEAAKQNVASLSVHMNEGRKIIATNPSCSQMIRVEYPRLLGTDEAKKLAAQTMDPMEFLAGLASRGKLKKDFKSGAGNISYHMPCHLRAQNVGYKTRDVLALLPDTTVKVVEECSGHDGTWAMKKGNFEQSLKWGSRAFSAMAADNPKVTCSDCPLAAIQIEQGNGRRPLNPMQILAKSYRGEPID